LNYKFNTYKSKRTNF